MQDPCADLRDYCGKLLATKCVEAAQDRYVWSVSNRECLRCSVAKYLGESEGTPEFRSSLVWSRSNILLEVIARAL